MNARRAALEYCFASNPSGLADVLTGATTIAEATGRDSHDLLVVLGSGYARLAESLGNVTASIRLESLPGVPSPTAAGHGDTLLSVTIETGEGAVHALVASGRSHIYEGLAPTAVVQLARIAADNPLP